MSTNKVSTSKEKASFRNISVEMDGPLSKDVKKIEIDGLDVTSMVRSISIHAGVDYLSYAKIELIGHLKANIENIRSLEGDIVIIDKDGNRFLKANEAKEE